MMKISDALADDFEGLRRAITQDLADMGLPDNYLEPAINEILEKLGESPEALRGCVVAMSAVHATLDETAQRYRCRHIRGALDAHVMQFVALLAHPTTAVAVKILEGDTNVHSDQVD